LFATLLGFVYADLLQFVELDGAYATLSPVARFKLFLFLFADGRFRGESWIHRHSALRFQSFHFRHVARFGSIGLATQQSV
jgi:hypothetical protein